MEANVQWEVGCGWLGGELEEGRDRQLDGTSVASVTGLPIEQAGVGALTD